MAEPEESDVFESLWGEEDPFSEPANSNEVDPELASFLNKAAARSTSGREALTALSALAQQMQVYKPMSVAEQQRALQEYNEGLEAQAKLSVPRKRKPSTESALRMAVTRGEQAQLALVGSMFRLVMIMARELATDRYGKERALPMLEDLVAEANAEIIDAIPRFDPKQCPTFAVFAGRVARDRIRASLSHADAVRVPAAWVRLKRIASTRVPELAEELGRKPSTSEIQEALLERCMVWAAEHLTADQQSFPAEEREALMRAKLVKQGMIGAIERYEEVIAVTQGVTSIDAPLSGDGGSYADVLSTGSRDEVFDAVELTQLSTDITSALNTLGERERDIILHRFGLVDGEVWTYAKLAPRYGISAERVRQIEASVLSRLRGPSFSYLAAYLPGVDEIDEEPATRHPHFPPSPKKRPGTAATAQPRGP